MMLHTEVEARRTQCRHVSPIVQVDQRSGRANITFHGCAGSECMSWRWSTHTKIENKEARPTGFCARDRVAPIAHDLGLGEDPINKGDSSLLVNPDGRA